MGKFNLQWNTVILFLEPFCHDLKNKISVSCTKETLLTLHWIFSFIRIPGEEGGESPKSPVLPTVHVSREQTKRAEMNSHSIVQPDPTWAARLASGTGTSQPQDVTVNMGMAQKAGHEHEHTDLRMLGVSLRYLPRSAQFVVLSAAVFFFYLIYGYFQVSGNRVLLFLSALSLLVHILCRILSRPCFLCNSMSRITHTL